MLAFGQIKNRRQLRTGIHRLYTYRHKRCMRYACNCNVDGYIVFVMVMGVTVLHYYHYPQKQYWKTFLASSLVTSIENIFTLRHFVERKNIVNENSVTKFKFWFHIPSFFKNSSKISKLFNIPKLFKNSFFNKNRLN